MIGKSINRKHHSVFMQQKSLHNHVSVTKKERGEAPKKREVFFFSSSHLNEQTRSFFRTGGGSLYRAWRPLPRPPPPNSVMNLHLFSLRIEKKGEVTVASTPQKDQI